MCDFEEIIDNLEGQIRSSSYPNMIPAGTSSCQIKILFQEISILELFLLDLPAVDVVYENEYREWSSTQKVTTRHQLISPAHQVLLSVDFDKLPQRRIWMYYRGEHKNISLTFICITTRLRQDCFLKQRYSGG